MADYQVNYRQLSLIILGLAVISSGVYLFLNSDSSPVEDESTLSLDLQQDEVKPGDTVRITASNSTGPVEGVEINANGENIGNTNENGIAGYSVPENAEALNISGEHQGTTATLQASLEDGEFNVDNNDSDQDNDDSSEPEDDNSDSNNDDEGDNQNDGSEDDSGNQIGEDENDEQDNQQNNETDNSEPGETGLKLENDPVANELNTVTLMKNGEPVESSIYINNDEIGTTSSTGTLTFTVPNTQEITVSTDADIESETFEVEGYTNESDAGEPEEDPEVLNAYYQYTPENPIIGNEIEFKASQSTGNNLQSYEWSFGNGETASGETVTQAYEEPGTYTVELTVTDGEENTDSIDADITVEDASEPDLILRKPDDGSEHTETELQYNLTVYNGLPDSTYRIITNGNTVETAQLGQSGTVDITPTVTVPEGEFTTYAEIEQGGQTYTSETKTVTAGQTESDPVFTLNSPSDGQTIETFDNQTEVSFHYTVEERGWAEEATIQVTDSNGNIIEENTRPISSGETYGENFNPALESSEDGKNYYIQLIVGEKQEVSSFDIRKILPEFKLNLVDEAEVSEDRGGEEGFYGAIRFTYEFDIEEQATFRFLITNESGTEVGNYEQEVLNPGENTWNFQQDVPEGGQEYQWKGEIFHDDDLVNETEYMQFNVSKFDQDGEGIEPE